MKREAKFWISGQMLAKKTGLTRKELVTLRKLNKDFWTVNDNNAIVYNANKIPELLKLKTA